MNSKKSTTLTRPSRAFTLVELSLTVAIISIAAAIAAPRLGSSSSFYRVEAAAARIRAEIDHARRIAAATGTTIKVKLTHESKHDYLDLIGMPDGQGDTMTNRIDMRAAPYLAQFAGTTLNQNQIIFDAYGMPASGGDLVVQVGSHARAIRVDATTGRTEVVP